MTPEISSSTICGSLAALVALLKGIRGVTLGSSVIAEVRSVVEGAKALSRPNRRPVEDPIRQPLAAALARLENEITNFDEKQRHIALVDVGGPARIRGLAGSGKTVILAMKAAHIHLVDPESLILITFYTKSLRATIKSLVTRFYRLYSDSDPDWKHVHIRHGWGGTNIPGVYSDACARSGRAPLRLPEAVRLAGRGETAFGAACADLLNSGLVRSYYDHVLIDEGQDFPDSFYKFAFQLAKGERDRKSVIWAYDELQDIMNVKIRQPVEQFGCGPDGLPLVDLDRTAAQLPPGATNDAVLSKAYRNQRDVLVSAHALGFGVYGNIVQMLESAEHWEDVGYQVLSGPLVTGHRVEIVRPDRNSPLSVAELDGFPVIDVFGATNFQAEVNWVVDSIRSFISGGLQPEEVLVIALDDRNARGYLSKIAEELALKGLSSNNVIADPYNEPPFTISGRVTLSTVYRAKGNEAAAVFALGIDAVDTRLRGGRNKIFTAFTRSKAWLRVSGIVPGAAPIMGELRTAIANSPRITFTMPNLKEIETIQRGFSKKQAAARAAREQYLSSYAWRVSPRRRLRRRSSKAWRMNKADLVPQIRKSWMYAKALKVDELFPGPTALDASDSFKALAIEPDVSYEELYLAGLREVQYNILLKDFSFFQFGTGSVDGVRFAYYPNPFLGAEPNAVAELREMQEYVAEGVIDVDEFLHRASEIRRPQHPPLVRYEYSKVSVPRGHPPVLAPASRLPWGE